MSRRPLAVPAALASVLVLALGACGSSSGPQAESTTAAPSTAGGATSGAARPRPVPYAALGDSYAAAPGVPTTDLAGGCVRSDHNYPHLLAAARPELVLTDVTCSGAATADLTAREQVFHTSVAPQLDAVKRSTELVTLGIGGNDLGLFRAVLDHCLQGHADCLDGLHATRNLALVERHLGTALHDIHQRAPWSRIVLVGYPQLVAAGSRGCALLPADPAVLARVHDLIEDLARTMARAAERGDATYVDLMGPSAGHDICSASPWVNGQETTDEAVAFHPLLAEQQAVARLVGDAIAAG